jgi:thiol:disulfide interchange protein DsbC
MKRKTALAEVALTGLLACVAAAASHAGATEDKIRRTLESRFPDLVLQEVNKAQDLPGFYEVITPGEIVYTDAKAKILIAGKLLDTETKQDLTAYRWAQIHAIDFNSLPLELAIKTTRGDGSRKLVVFADPDCPFCRKLETELQGVTDVSVYTFLFPLEGIHPKAKEKAISINCAPDREKVWSDWMLKNVAFPAGGCAADSLAPLISLGEKLKINSTPTLFFADGRRVEAALTKRQLEQELARKVPAK